MAEERIVKPCAEEHLGLVHHCANRFRGRGIAYEELYSAGCEGLLKAVRAFDTTRGVQFSTYAVPVILGEIRRLFRSSGTIHISRSIQERARKLQQVQEALEQSLGRSPTLSELSLSSGETPEDCAEALCTCQSPLSLSRWETTESESEGEYEIPVEAKDQEISDRLSLRQLMDQLPPVDRRLLELRYYEELTQTRTAKILGLSQVQVSRKERKLLRMLRGEMLGYV